MTSHHPHGHAKHCVIELLEPAYIMAPFTFLKVYIAAELFNTVYCISCDSFTLRTKYMCIQALPSTYMIYQ